MSLHLKFLLVVCPPVGVGTAEDVDENSAVISAKEE